MSDMLPLWEHQKRALELSVPKPAFMLSMGVATGKSRVVVEWINRKKLDRVLIVAPKNVVDLVWEDQIQRWSTRPLSVVALDTRKSVAKKAEQLAEHPDSNVVITNYESVWRSPLKEALVNFNFQAVVLDESHRAKGSGSKIGWWTKNMGKTVDHRLCLTATPLADKPFDIYSQYRFLQPEIFGTNFAAFKSRYGIFHIWNNLAICHGYQNKKELSEKIFQIAYQVAPDDVLPDLPQEMFLRRFCDMPASTRKIYNDMNSTLVADSAAGIITAQNAMVRIGKLHCIAQGWTKTDEGIITELNDSKQKLLTDILTDLNEPVIVVCKYHIDMDHIKIVCDKMKLSSSEQSGRKHEIKAWLDGDTQVLVVQNDSAAEGIDLTRARLMVFYSRSYSYKSKIQMEGRIRRTTQKSNRCVYIDLVARNTVDEIILHALSNKENVNQAILRGLGYEY